MKKPSNKTQVCFDDKNGREELAIVGQPSDFYAYDKKRWFNRRAPWSGWVKSHDGSNAYWQKFLELKRNKDKEGFQSLVDEIFEKFPNPEYL